MVQSGDIILVRSHGTVHKDAKLVKVVERMDTGGEIVLSLHRLDSDVTYVIDNKEGIYVGSVITSKNGYEYYIEGIYDIDIFIKNINRG